MHEAFEIARVVTVIICIFAVTAEAVYITGWLYEDY